MGSLDFELNVFLNQFVMLMCFSLPFISAYVNLLSMSNDKDRIAPAVRWRATVSPATKAKALNDYLFSDKSRKEIAEECNISFSTLLTWMKNEKWAEQRRQLERDLQQEISLERTRFVKRNLLKVMKDHLKLGQDFEKEVKRRLDLNSKRASPTTAEDLEKLGKALQTGSNVSARAVGLDRREAFAQSPQMNVNLLFNTDLNPTPARPTRPAPVSEPIDVQDVTPVDEDKDRIPF